MNELYIKARAKINLNLLVLDKREDNYHNIKSVFQKVNLYDEIYLKKINENEFKMITNMGEINNKENIIYKAYMKLKEKYKNITGVQVRLNKKIPMQAGMAGGSTDCAAFIVLMNRLFDLKLSKEDMLQLGKELGADVIPCFYNKAIIAEGIGDVITKIDTNFKYYIVIIKPEISCSTKDMYKKIDTKKISQKDTTKEIVEALESSNMEMLASNLYNVFEEVIDRKDLIENIKQKLINNGAISSLMTGSGSAIYGIFKDKNTAKIAYESLKDKYQTYICTSYNSRNDYII